MRSERLARALTTIGAIGAVVAVLAFARHRWDWSVARRHRGFFIDGLKWTIVVSALAMAGSLALGTVAGLARLSRRVLPNQLAKIYVECVRGTPLIVQILIAYYALSPMIRLDSKLLVGALVLAVFSGAYVAEIVRAGIEAIDRGQIEASRALGLGHRQTMRHVVLPQAMRQIIPPLTGQFVSLIKDSSLLHVIGLYELTKAAYDGSAATYKYWEFYLPLAALYLLLTLPLTRLAERLERRVNPTRRGVHVG